MGREGKPFGKPFEQRWMQAFCWPVILLVCSAVHAVHVQDISGVAILDAQATIDDAIKQAGDAKIALKAAKAAVPPAARHGKLVDAAEGKEKRLVKIRATMRVQQKAEAEKKTKSAAQKKAQKRV